VEFIVYNLYDCSNFQDMLEFILFNFLGNKFLDGQYFGNVFCSVFKG